MWHHISGISFLEHQEQETSATDKIKKEGNLEFRNLRKRETIQSPKNEQLRTIEQGQGKAVKNGRGKYQGKQKLFS